MFKVEPVRQSYLMVLLVVVLAFCQPVHVYPLPNFIEELLVSIGVLLVGGALLWRLQGLRVSSWMLMWLVLGLLLAGSAAMHPALFVSGKIFTGFYWLVAGIALLIGDQVDWDKDGEQLSGRLAWAVLLAAIVGGVGGFLRYLDLGVTVSGYLPSAVAGRMTGLVGHSNFFAFISLFGLIALGWLFNQRRLELSAVVLTAGLLVLCIVLSGNRSVLIAWGCFSLLLFLRRKHLYLDRWLCVLVGSIILWIIVRLILSVFGERLSAALGLGFVGEGLVGAVSERGLSSSGRLAEWSVAWQIFLKNPLGVGIGNYPWSSFEEHLELGRYSSAGLFLHAHNSPLQLIVELGWGGAVWVVALLGMSAKALWSASRSMNRMLPIAVVLVLQVYGLFEFPLWLMHFLALHMLLVPALGGRRFHVSLKLGKAFAVLAILFAFLVTAIYVPMVGRFYWANTQYFLRNKVTAEDYSFIGSVLADPVLEPYGYMIYFAHFEPSEKTLSDERAALERFRGYLPYAPIMMRLSIVRQAQGDEQAAVRLAGELGIFYGGGVEGLYKNLIDSSKGAFPDVSFEPLIDAFRAAGHNAPAAGVAQ